MLEQQAQQQHCGNMMLKCGKSCGCQSIRTYCCKTIVLNMIKNNYGRIVNVAPNGKDGNVNVTV